MTIGPLVNYNAVNRLPHIVCNILPDEIANRHGSNESKI